jgi:betaine reductase
LEKAGIPVVQITSAMSIAKMVGSNRVVLGHGIVHVTGDAKLAPEEEKELRRKLVQKGSTRCSRATSRPALIISLQLS